MARIRKTPDNLKKSDTLWRIAIYIRLSREDADDESYSVKNQRQRLLQYVQTHMLNEGAEIVDFYIDDGYTGTDSDRDDFQRMLKDIDKGRINCVVVKDLSRLSRNDWECKRYLQHLFVAKDIRFISLELPKLDSFKNPDEVYELGVAIQSMYNENHCRETSIKVRGTFDVKRKNGEFIGAFPPYGYLKDQTDKHHFIVDPEAAQIVKDIFHWFAGEGMSKSGIVKRLNSMGILSPAAYKRKQGMKYYNPAVRGDNPLWSARSVSAMLSNQMYIGHMVQGKQRVKSYKVHTRVSVPESEWYIAENTHEAIIDKETFDKAQEIIRRDTRTAPNSGKLYLFSGYMRCADCGGAMGRRRSKDIVYYTCKKNNTHGLCSRHGVRHDRLERAVLEAIQKQIALIDNMSQLTCELESIKVCQVASRRYLTALKLRKRELEKITALRTGLYIDFKSGDITRDEYYSMKKEFMEKEERLKQDIAGLEEENQDMPQGAESSNPYLDAFLKNRNIQSLERGIVTELIKAIHIHEGGGITIDFNFADELRSKA